MTDNEASTESDAIASAKQPAKLDLSRYRTDGLVAAIVELISVPQAFRTVLRVSVLLTLIVAFAVYVAFLGSELSGVTWVAVAAYSLVAGCVLGIMLGLLRVLARALLNIEEILKVTLEITDSAAEDYANLQSGATTMPTAGELVEQVYGEVLLPTLERAVSEAFGFLATPLLWIYRRSIGAAVRFVIKKMARLSLSKEDEPAVTDAVEREIGGLAKYTASIRAYTAKAAELVHRVSGTIRFYGMLPLYIAFFVCLGLASVPLLILRFLATGEPAE